MTDTSIPDKIYIRDLALRCIIGINGEERNKKQDVILNITLYADLRKACASDAIEDTPNYKTIKKNIITLVESSSFFLLEKLAQAVAQICLHDSRIKKVRVTVDKPGALTRARSVAVSIIRKKEN